MGPARAPSLRDAVATMVCVLGRIGADALPEIEDALAERCGHAAALARNGSRRGPRTLH